MEHMTLFGNRTHIKLDLPIARFTGLKISHEIKSHSSIWLQAIIEEDDKEDLLKDSFENKAIMVLDKDGDSLITLFSGKVQRIQCQSRNQILIADIYGISYSIELDKEKKCRSFQNPNLTYENIVETIQKDTCARFLWRVDEDVKINRPFIQYKETDWAFMSRLASHFNTSLQVSSASSWPDFSFGINPGEERSLNGTELTEYGFNNDYDDASGYEESHDRGMYDYIKIKTEHPWQLGDYAKFRNNRCVVYKALIQVEKGELKFTYTLGAPGLVHQKTIYNDRITGLQLEGTIKKVEKDDVYIKLFNDEMGADYGWTWVPEVGNLSYCMPEPEEKVMLTFPSNDEKDGLAVCLLRNNGDSDLFQCYNNRELSTAYGKRLAIFPDKAFIEGKGGTPSLSLSDVEGFLMNSEADLTLTAQKEIVLKAEKVEIQAPQSIVFQTAVSNIELCENFNFYAPEGVNRSINPSSPLSPLNDKKKHVIKEPDEKEHWQLSYGAMGAVPVMDLSTTKIEDLANLTTCGAVPKLGRGSSIMAMSQVLEGKKTGDTSFPQAFSTMGGYTIKGGIPLAKDEIEV